MSLNDWEKVDEDDYFSKKDRCIGVFYQDGTLQIKRGRNVFGKAHAYILKEDSKNLTGIGRSIHQIKGKNYYTVNVTVKNCTNYIIVKNKKMAHDLLMRLLRSDNADPYEKFNAGVSKMR